MQLCQSGYYNYGKAKPPCPMANCGKLCAGAATFYKKDEEAAGGKVRICRSCYVELPEQERWRRQEQQQQEQQPGGEAEEGDGTGTRYCDACGQLA